MKADAEVYRGIEFVRLSSLPNEQNKIIADSSITKKIIKILRGTELLHDCLPYDLYQQWYRDNFTSDPNITAARPIGTRKLKLVLR